MNHLIFKIILLPISFIVIGSFALTKVAHAADNTKLTTGLFYTDGQGKTINSDNVSSISVPLLISVKRDKLTFGVSMSYLSIKSNSLKEQGIGDTILSLGYDVTNNFSLKLREKVPTGEENKSLSTGKNDTSVQLDYFADANQKVSFFGSVGYKFVGKVTGHNMQDTAFASIGTGHIYGKNTNIGVTLDYKETVFRNLDNQLGIAAFVSKPINETYNLSAFAGYDNTQTNNIGVSLTTKF